MLHCTTLDFLFFLEVKVNTQLKFVVGLSKIISIDDFALSSMYVDAFSRGEVLGTVVFFSFETHARIDGVDGLFG